MPADQQQVSQWQGALTRLTRLAQRQPEAREWLEDLLRRNMPAILAPAIAVAEETGDPLPEVLARVLSAEASPEAHEAVARAVEMDATVLQDLAIVSVRALISQDTWPAGEVPAVRRHALQVALASRLLAAGRREEARAAAEQALARIPDDPSSRARSVDAYDVLTYCQLAADDPQGAVDSATRALAIRKRVDDPLRDQAEGERMLGVALRPAGRLDEACLMLVNAVTRVRNLLADGRDVLFTFEDQLASGADSVRVVVTIGWLQNGFDEIVPDHGFRSQFLVRWFHLCLANLLAAAEEDGERLSADALTTLQTELAAAIPLLRRGLEDTVLRLRMLRFLSSAPAHLLPALSSDEFDAMADDAMEADGPELVAVVRMTEADYLRHQDPVDRRALEKALSELSWLLAGDEAVAVMQEAVEVASGDSPLAHSSMLHNLSRRLAANGRPAEGFSASLQAVNLVSEAVAAGTELPPLVIASALQTLVQRGLESETEIAFQPSIAATAEKMLGDIGRETGADLTRPVSAACGLFDSAMRQGDTAMAERLEAAVSGLATVRPDDEAAQLARALLASQLLWQALANGLRDRARGRLAEVIASARNVPDMDAVTAELGKCAADMISFYWEAGDVEAAAQLARETRAALLSEAYLATRRRDLGEDQAAYIQTMTELTEDKPAEENHEPGQ